MYPNTIEPIRTRRMNTTPIKRTPISYWIRKCFFFFSLTLLVCSGSLLANTPDLALHHPTDTVAPALQNIGLHTETLAQDMAIATVSTEEMTNDRHPMERLRQTLVKNLQQDGLSRQDDEATILHFPDEVSTIDGQPINMGLAHKYTAILNSYGIQSGDHVQIRVHANYIMAGSFDADGSLLEGKVRGAHPRTLAGGR